MIGGNAIHRQPRFLARGSVMKNYLVTHGPYGQTREWFATFEEALACQRAHRDEQPEGASLYGAEYDSEHDGLTDEERLEVIG